jgi:hypothetical protein
VNMNLLLSDETSASNHSTTQCHIPEDFYESYPTSSATLKWTSAKLKGKNLQFFLWSIVNVPFAIAVPRNVSLRMRKGSLNWRGV